MNASTGTEPPIEKFHPLKVLLLEDSFPDAELVEARLQAGGLRIDVTRAESHAEFTEALSRGTFDIILSDYNIPGFEGTSALAAARTACPETPFVFVTGALGEEKAIELLKRGATDYVLKDGLERLVPSVERALSEAQSRAQRKKAEEARLESERALETLIGNLPGMAFRCVPHEPWCFEYASPGAFELTGYQSSDFYAQGSTTWSALMHADDTERVAAEARAAFDAKRQLTVTYRIRSRSGQEKWVWDRSVGIYSEDGVLQAIEGFVTDITQQKEAEADAQRRADFEKHLIGIVSHDLRNPLNAILLASAAALRREELDPGIVKFLLRIQSSGERAARMIRDLLDFTQARLGGGIHIERQQVSLKELVQQVVEEAQTTHPEREIRTHHDGACEGEWAPDRLAQVVSNLLANALRYSPEGTPVALWTRSDGDRVVLTVHNLGEPISDELRPRLFQPMQRGGGGDSHSRNVGLGLYIVDHIVRAHGGHVDVRSSADEGTSFNIYLPRKAPSA